MSAVQSEASLADFLTQPSTHPLADSPRPLAGSAAVSRPIRSSVVITTYNRPDALLAVLHSLLRQTVRDFEILVADDGSALSTREALEDFAKKCDLPLWHVWQSDAGFRAARARNRAALAAHSEHLIFLDGDCVCPPQFVQRHRQLLQAAGPHAFVNGSRILLTPEATQAAMAGGLDLPGLDTWAQWRLWQRGWTNKVRLDAPHFPLAWRRQTRFQWKGIRSCNFSLMREDYVRVGGFDESFEGWGHEDADLVLRLHHAGAVRINGFWATEVWHLWHQERSRGQESQNHARVLQRQQSGQIQASVGLTQYVPGEDEHVSCLRA